MNNIFRRVLRGAGVGALVAPLASQAAIDTAAVTTALTDAGTAAGTVGAAVLVVGSPHCGAASWSSAAPQAVGCERAQSPRYWQHHAPPPLPDAG